MFFWYLFSEFLVTKNALNFEWNTANTLGYIKVNFLLRKIFHGNLNEAVSLVEIASFRSPRKIFLKRKLNIY